MALFNRKKDKSVLPEVDQYYQGEKRDRTWLAWILAVVSIIVVVLILVGLFFAGKWAYNAITNDDSGDVATTDEQDDENLPSFDGGTDEESENDDQSQNESENQTNEGTDETTEEPEGTVDAPAQTEIPSGQSSETPRTGATDEDLPNTGPAGLATTFLVTSGIAGTAHYVVTRRKNRD